MDNFCSFLLLLIFQRIVVVPRSSEVSRFQMTFFFSCKVEENHDQKKIYYLKVLDQTSPYCNFLKLSGAIELWQIHHRDGLAHLLLMY